MDLTQLVPSINVHHAIRATISPMIDYDGAYWQNITFLTQDGNELKIVVFSSDGQPLLPPTEYDFSSLNDLAEVAEAVI